MKYLVILLILISSCSSYNSMVTDCVLLDDTVINDFKHELYFRYSISSIGNDKVTLSKSSINRYISNYYNYKSKTDTIDVFMYNYEFVNDFHIKYSKYRVRSQYVVKIN